MRKKSEERQGPLGAALPGLIRDCGWEIMLDMHSVFSHWKILADEDTAEHAAPLKIVAGVLWVEVENSGWMQDLQYRKVQLLKNINAFLQKSRIRDVRYVLPEGLKPVAEQKTGAIRFIAPPAEQVREFAQQIESISDTASREALMRFWYLAHACQREGE